VAVARASAEAGRNSRIRSAAERDLIVIAQERRGAERGPNPAPSAGKNPTVVKMSRRRASSRRPVNRIRL
jgi:hypothetical protein